MKQLKESLRNYIYSNVLLATFSSIALKKAYKNVTFILMNIFCIWIYIAPDAEASIRRIDIMFHGLGVRPEG